MFLGFFAYFFVYLGKKNYKIMKYNDLIDQLSEATDLPKNKTKSLVEKSMSVLQDQLNEGKGVTIPNLGTFSTKVKEIRKVYSPHHKKHMMVPPKRVVDFTPASGLKEKLKFVEPEDE